MYRRGVRPACDTVAREDQRAVVAAAPAVVHWTPSWTERLSSQRHRPRLVVHQESWVSYEFIYKPIRTRHTAVQLCSRGGMRGNAVNPNIRTRRNGDTVAFHQIGHQMSDFKAKMHQIRFRLGRLRPRPRWGSLQRSPDPLAGFKGAYF